LASQRAPVFLEQRGRGLAEGDRPVVAMAALGALAHVPARQAPGVHDVVADHQVASVQVEVLPPQRADLAGPKTGRGPQTKEQVQLRVLLRGGLERLSRLRPGRHQPLGALRRRRLHQRRRVIGDPAIPGRQGERAGDDRVHVAEPARGQRLARLAETPALAQGHVEPIQRRRINLGKPQLPESRLDPRIGQRPVALDGAWADRLVVVLAPLQVQVHQLGEGLRAGAAVPAFHHLCLEPGLFLLSLPAAAVDLSADAALLAGDRVHAGVDADLPPVATLVDRHSVHL
jgi:hypothetical protein